MENDEQDISIVYAIPDQLVYKDRELMKWQGLMLSQHLDVLKEMMEKDNQNEPSAKEKMSESDIAEILQISNLDKLPIALQADITKEGYFYLKLLDGHNTTCELSQIRNLAIMDPADWYSKKI